MELNERLSEFDDRGATVVAVSIDPIAKSEEFVLDKMIGFPLAEDADGSAVRTWGLTQSGKKRAVPATFVVARGGEIVYRKIGDSVSDRSTVEDILAAIP